MQRTLLTCLTCGALLCAADAALAQAATPATTASASAATGTDSANTGAATSAASAAKPAAASKEAKPAAGATPSVTVAGERPTGRIDRQVYDVKSDLGSSNGTAADALNNVPSVNVDPDGTIILRGNSNVQVMVDGKPSAMLQGDNRGPALQSMPAEDIESVEVINNPGAQFGNEAGGGPILNLVMRRNRKPGGYGSVSANGGTAGRYNSAVNGSYNEGAWGFQGGLNVRHDGRNSTGSTERDQLNAATGKFAHTSQSSTASGLNDMAGANGTISYNLGPSDQLAASLNYNSRTDDQRGADRYTEYAAGNGSAATSDYLRSTTRTGDNKSYAWGARWDHKGELPGETLKVNLRVSTSDNDNTSTYANVYAVLPAGASNSRAWQTSGRHNRIIDFTGDYERPLAGGVFKAGYKASSNDSSSDTVYTDINPLTLAETLNTARSNAFKLNEKVYALYGTYRMRLTERWGALAGLRAEVTDMDIEQVTNHVQAQSHYLNTIPSAYATYKVDDNANLRFAYARRLRRPNQMDLNPYVMYRDELNVVSGNPRLKPTKTDSFEVGYEAKVWGLETALRGYYRRDTDAIVDRRYFIANNVLLTTRENGAGSHSGGLEFTASGKLTPDLTINASGNLMRMNQTVQDTAGKELERSANSLSGRVRLNYKLDSANQVQAMLMAMGKMLSGTGYRSPNSSLNLSYNHSVNGRLSMVMNVTDVFNTNKMQTVVDSATLRETSTRRFDGRVVYLGLSYRFGGPGGNQQEPGMERMGPPPGGPGGPPMGG
ncbi:TonB-dependent receptor domain-containing protein [Oxalobacteraceae bacterium A2-2]